MKPPIPGPSGLHSLSPDHNHPVTRGGRIIRLLDDSRKGRHFISVHDLTNADSLDDASGNVEVRLQFKRQTPLRVRMRFSASQLASATRRAVLTRFILTRAGAITRPTVPLRS
jgi:hypothetical protein